MLVVPHQLGSLFVKTQQDDFRKWGVKILMNVDLVNLHSKLGNVACGFEVIRREFSLDVVKAKGHKFGVVVYVYMFL